jgi:putative PIN family toxin of toxin-antitoxin system
MVQQFLFRLTTIAITTPGDLLLSVVDDPSDNRYLECAVEGNATHLVSGDRDLLRLGRFEGIAIVTPQAFLEVLVVQ